MSGTLGPQEPNQLKFLASVEEQHRWKVILPVIEDLGPRALLHYELMP